MNNTITISMLHMKIITGNTKTNQKTIQMAVEKAKKHGTDILVTPELSLTGLQFNQMSNMPTLIEEAALAMNEIIEMTRKQKLLLIVGFPEVKDHNTYYNTAMVINPWHSTVGRQRKKLTLSDGWSVPGNEIHVFDYKGIRFGVMICADAYTKEVANTIKEKKADFIIAPSSWGPGLYGPEGEWEQRSLETELPVFVCNRTGEEITMDFNDAESHIIHKGERVLTYKSKDSTLITFTWEPEQNLKKTSFIIESLGN